MYLGKLSLRIRIPLQEQLQNIPRLIEETTLARDQPQTSADGALRRLGGEGTGTRLMPCSVAVPWERMLARSGPLGAYSLLLTAHSRQLLVCLSGSPYSRLPLSDSSYGGVGPSFVMMLVAAQLIEIGRTNGPPPGNGKVAMEFRKDSGLLRKCSRSRPVGCL